MKSLKRLQIEYDIINFSNKASERLIVAVEKSMEKCMEFYKKVLKTHNRCQTYSTKRLQEFPAQEDHLKYLDDRLKEDEINIKLVKGLNENVIKNLVAQATDSNFLLEDQLRVTPSRVEDIKSQLCKPKVTARFLDPTNFETIVVDDVAWNQFMNGLFGPT